MAKYDVKTLPAEVIADLEVQQMLADGRWTPIQRVAVVDTQAGYAEVFEADAQGKLVPGDGGEALRRRVPGDFRLVHTKTGDVNPDLAPKPDALDLAAADVDEPPQS